jgi:regulator of RNase E activity RraA
MSRYFRA